MHLLSSMLSKRNPQSSLAIVFWFIRFYISFCFQTVKIPEFFTEQTQGEREAATPWPQLHAFSHFLCSWAARWKISDMKPFLCSHLSFLSARASWKIWLNFVNNFRVFEHFHQHFLVPAYFIKLYPTSSSGITPDFHLFSFPAFLFILTLVKGTERVYHT